MATERNYRFYISREKVKRTFLNIGSTVTADDTKISDLIEMVSLAIEEQLGVVFYPVTKARHFDHPSPDNVLKLDEWLVSVDTFTTQNTEVSVTSGQYYPMCGNSYIGPPYDRIVMKTDGTRPNLLYSGTMQQANAITGKWGWRDEYGATGATVLNDPSLTAAGTSLTVLAGKLETHQMLLIGTEQIYVSAFTAGSPNDTVTIVRAQNGTTAAIHLKDVAVYRQLVPFDIEELCGILVARLFHRGTTAWADRTGTPESGLTYIKAMVAEAQQIVEKYSAPRRYSNG